jgi:hypothetical protein
MSSLDAMTSPHIAVDHPDAEDQSTLIVRPVVRRKAYRRQSHNDVASSAVFASQLKTAIGKKFDVHQLVVSSPVRALSRYIQTSPQHQTRGLDADRSLSRSSLRYLRHLPVLIELFL